MKKVEEANTPERDGSGALDGDLLSGERSLGDLFQSELEQQAAVLTHNLLELEKGEAVPEVLQNLMRSAHSVKGAARIANRRAAVRIAHEMEECFVLAQHGSLVLDRGDVDVFLKALDFLTENRVGQEAEREDRMAMRLAGHLAALERIAARNSGKAPVPKPEPETGGAGIKKDLVLRSPEKLDAALQPADRYLRLTTESLDRLLALASESLVEARWLRPFAESLQQLREGQARIAKGLQKLRGDWNRSQLDSLSRQVSDAQQSLSMRLQELEVFDQRAAQMSRCLYLEVLRTRMRPLNDLSRRLPRMVRDLARLLGKRVRLEISGENTQVDREVLERIEAPLVHLLRNAVDHGCEAPDMRQKVAKPPECVLRVEARHSGGMLLLTVSDDGTGIDPAGLRRQIERKGLVEPAKLRNLSDTHLLDYLFVPGFTMRENATEISGRGVGLDLVHTAVRNLHGAVRVINRPGRGMEFQLQLPLTISVLRALLVEIDGEPYALALSRISKVSKLGRNQLTWIQGIAHYTYSGRHISLADARCLFGLEPPEHPSRDLHIVVLGARDPRYGLVVDRFLGERELLVQPLDARLGKVRDISGAALMEDGQPLLIIDVEEMLRSIDRLASLGRLAIDAVSFMDSKEPPSSQGNPASLKPGAA